MLSSSTPDYLPPQLLGVKLYGEVVIRHHYPLLLRRLREFLDLDAHEVGAVHYFVLYYFSD